MAGAIGAITSTIGASSGVGGLLGNVVSTVLSSALSGGGQSAPAPQAMPQAPAPVQAPPAPEVTQAEAETVTDPEAARVRARKRRSEATDRQLFALSEEDDDATILTKTLLGD